MASKCKGNVKKLCATGKKFVNKCKVSLGKDLANEQRFSVECENFASISKVSQGKERIQLTKIFRGTKFCKRMVKFYKCTQSFFNNFASKCGGF